MANVLLKASVISDKLVKDRSESYYIFYWNYFVAFFPSNFDKGCISKV